MYVYVQKKHNLKGSKWKQAKCSQTNKEINVMYPYNGGFFGHKKDWSTDHPTTWMNLGNNMLSGKKKKKTVTKGHIIWLSVCEIPTTGKSIEKDCTLVIAYQQMGGKKTWTDSEYLMNLSFLFEVTKMFGN